MKILCIGRKGDNRSVALAWLLKQRGHDAIAVGMRCMGRDTRTMLCKWAEMIIVVHQKCCSGVPPEDNLKVSVFSTPITETYPATDKKLLEILENYMREAGLWT